MKLASFFKRMLCVMLVLAMLCLEVIPGMAFAVGHDHDHNQISFERVDNDSVSAGLIPGGRTEITDDAAYADTDVVRVSIILSRSSTIDAGYSAMDITGNQAALKYREDLKKDQTNMVHQIEQATQADLDVVWNLTLAANIISANVQYGQIETIAKLPGVKSVVLENQYQPCETKDGEIVPNMATSGAQIGTGPVWEAGYTGAGMRIAVIDFGRKGRYPLPLSGKQMIVVILPCSPDQGKGFFREQTVERSADTHDTISHKPDPRLGMVGGQYKKSRWIREKSTQNASLFHYFSPISFGLVEFLNGEVLIPD